MSERAFVCALLASLAYGGCDRGGSIPQVKVLAGVPGPAASPAPGPPASEAVAPPPRPLVEALGLSPVYTKHVSIGDFPVLGSSRVSDYAMVEAVFLVRKMIGHRPDILGAMAARRIRLVVMAPSEMTTDVPEHSDLLPRDYWDRRARGLGSTDARPAVSCAEENLLDLPGDPYATENILIHEFAHSIHEQGLAAVDATFDRRLDAAYQSARQQGLWKGTYAMQSRNEYWAEGAQSWFDCNRANDNEHGPIDTRDKLRAYDPALASLLTEVFGDGPWRYTKPSKRPPGERAHLAGFDRSKAGRFAWPERLREPPARLLSWLHGPSAPTLSPSGPSSATTVLFVNQRAGEVTLDWLDFKGQPKRYATIMPGATLAQQTFAGHVWAVAERGVPLGTVVAGEQPGRAEIR